MSEALMPSYVQRVYIAGLLTPMRWAITRGIARTTGISALGECPRHWYQCQGQARPALTKLLANLSYIIIQRSENYHLTLKKVINGQLLLEDFGTIISKNILSILSKLSI